jgi:hypothetical protein
MFFATDQTLIQQHTEQNHSRNSNSNNNNNHNNNKNNNKSNNNNSCKTNNNTNQNINKSKNITDQQKLGESTTTKKSSNKSNNNNSNNIINRNNNNKTNKLTDQQNAVESTKEELTVTEQQNDENMSGKIEAQASTKDRLRREKRKNGKIKKVVETQQNTNAESVNRNQKVGGLKQRPINENNAENQNYKHSLNISFDYENNSKQILEENDCLIEASKSSEDFPNVEFSNQPLPVHHSSNISNNFVVCENNNKQVFEPKNSENVYLIETLNSSEGFPNVESSTKFLPVFKEKKNAELQAVILNELVENGKEVNFLQSEKERLFPSNEKSDREEKSFNNRFDCHYCNKAYISRKSLLRHTKAKHRACHRCGETLDYIEKHVCSGKDVQSQTKERILLLDNEKESGNLISDLKKVTQSQTEADNNHQFENESSSKKAAAGNCK